jgi:hypothetical protein
MQLGSMACLPALTGGVGQDKGIKENAAVLNGNGTVLKSEL